MSDGFIVGLITTYNRPELLKTRALKSVKSQSLQPNVVILVDNSDEKTILETNKQNFHELFPNGIYLKNGGFPSAAGTWNFGLKYINENYPDSWTAILDDDDEWLENHLQNNSPYMTDCDVVLGGIRTILDGKNIEERNPKTIKTQDVFSTNPGWQGSNTFIRTKTIIEAGSFDESLLCTHDRDLAIRVLSIPDIRIIGTGITSVNYYLDHDRESLTLSKSRGKHTGLLQFYAKHNHSMNEEDKFNFISRANFFGLDKEIFSIIDRSNDEKGFPPLSKQPKTKLGKIIKNTNWRTKQSWWRFRNRPIMTKIMGRQFTRSRSKIEIDLTYECNLKCHGCNRSCRQAPDKTHISLSQIDDFIEESISRKIYWKRIRLLGGEPTLHPDFEEILYKFAEYKLNFPKTRLEVTTNGFGRRVKRNIIRIPPFFHIENTAKTSVVQEGFYAFNMAPIDDQKYKNLDFTNGCSNIEDCGIGLTPSGYYPCTLAGGIDRILGIDMGRKTLPESEDDMLDLLKEFCKMCGRFKSRVFKPPWINDNPQNTSPKWRNAYQLWSEDL